MKFNTLYVSKWTDGDPSDTTLIETETYTLHAMVAGESCQREKVIADYCRMHGIHSVVLCPGFTHAMVADVAMAVGPAVSVAASRSDGPGSSVTGPAMNEARKGLKR